MDSGGIQIIVMIIMLICSSYFSATETAFSSLNKTRIKTLAEKGNKKAEKVLLLSEQYDKLLSTIKDFSKARIISLFGCVGYSDLDKRKEMTESVDKYSDYIIITTDNRGKVPFEDISNDIEKFIKHNKYISIEDRKSAINFGVGMLKENDILVLIGKGAEDFQNINGERVEYSDIAVVEDIISRRCNK